MAEALGAYCCELVSYCILTLPAARIPLNDRGFAVWTSIVAPMPPDCIVAWLCLCTVTLLTISEASVSKLNSRPSLSVAMGLPFSRTRLNSGPKPLTVTNCPSPSARSIDTPEIRCSASAKFWSGNLPISTDWMVSIITFALRLMPTDCATRARNPLTSMYSIS